MKTSPQFFLYIALAALLGCEPSEPNSSSDTADLTEGTGETETGDPTTGTTGTPTTSSTDPTSDASSGSGTQGETEQPDTSETETTGSADPVCGNGIVEQGEECDDGLLADNGPCIGACFKNICGDGFIYEGVELCDAGEQNGVYAGPCGEDCTTNNIPHCGDGILQDGYETCEHGEIDPDGVTCNPGHCQWGESRYIFLSSETVQGSLASELIPENMTGLARADTLCQVLAVGAGLPGSYYAWLSDNNNTPGYSDAAERIGGAQDGQDVLYVMPQGGVVVAHGWAELVSDGPAAAIVRTESGEVVNPMPIWVWTNTGAGGFSLGEDSCENWSSTEGFGWIGVASVGPNWSSLDPDFCDFYHHLYCVQGQSK